MLWALANMVQCWHSPGQPPNWLLPQKPLHLPGWGFKTNCLEMLGLGQGRKVRVGRRGRGRGGLWLTSVPYCHGNWGPSHKGHRPQVE